MPFLSWIIFTDLLQICPWAVVAFRYLHAPEDALVLSSWRTCTKKAQRNALSFNLSAEREAPRNCPYNPLNIKHLHNYELCSYGLCMAKRVLQMAIRCLLFDRWMSTMQLQSSVCQRIGNTASFFCQHSMHIFIKKGRSVLIQDDTRSAFRWTPFTILWVKTIFYYAQKWSRCRRDR